MIYRFSIFCCMALAASTPALAQPAIEQAGQAQIDLIRAVISDQYTITRTAAIRSGSHKKAWYVGASLHTPDNGETIGIWLISGAKSAPGMMFSVNQPAHQSSGMGMADRTQAKARPTDTEATALQNHLHQQN